MSNLDFNHTNQHEVKETIEDLMLNLILGILAYICYMFQSITVEGTYTWLLRALSLISIALILYINWNKAVEIYKKKRSKVP